MVDSEGEEGTEVVAEAAACAGDMLGEEWGDRVAGEKEGWSGGRREVEGWRPARTNSGGQQVTCAE